MLHLPAERLAALADDEPTATEAEHLTICARCASERAAHGRLLALSMDERRRIGPALNSWDTLSARLRMEGLVRPGTARLPGERERGTPVAPAEVRVSIGVRRVALLRIAAGLLVAAGGAIAGRLSAGASPLPVAALAGNSGGGAAAVAVADSSTAFASDGEALNVLITAQREYQRAAAYLAAHDTTSGSDEASDRYRTRLAALDQLAETSRAALNEAPEDPVLNQYYLSALGAREATLRQLGSVLPVGTRLTRF